MKSAGISCFRKAGLERRGVGGKSARGIDQGLIVRAARQPEFVLQSRRFKGQHVCGAIDGLDQVAQIFADGGLGGGNALGCADAGGLIGALTVQFRHDLGDRGKEFLAEAAVGEGCGLRDAEIARASQHLITFGGDAIHVTAPLLDVVS